MELGVFDCFKFICPFSTVTCRALSMQHRTYRTKFTSILQVTYLRFITHIGGSHAFVVLV
jgi:hypothetical protein